MANPQPKFLEIYDEIASLGRGNVDEFSFKRIKREIDNLRTHDSVISADLMAMLYFHKNDYLNAIKHHQIAIDQAPDLSLLYGNYGITLRAAQKPIEAQEKLLVALSLKPETQDLIAMLVNAILTCIDIYDVKTLDEVLNGYSEVIEEVMTAMPAASKQKLTELESLTEEAGIARETLAQTASFALSFFRQQHIEPVGSHALIDPDGGLYLSYDLPISVDELHALNESYIDFLMENNVHNIDISASFRCA